MRWRTSRGEKIGAGSTIQDRYSCPLLYQPGTGWRYSPGPDWAGLMVERVNDGISLQAYMQKYLWQPLGIRDMTFWLKDREDLRARMPDVSVRDPQGGAAAVYAEGLPMFFQDAKDAMGGSGVRGTAPEYLKILQALLVNEGKVLKNESVDELFRPSLSGQSKEALKKIVSDPVTNLMLGGLPLGREKDYAVGGMVLEEDMPGWTRRGMLSWGGMPNLVWVCWNFFL